MGKTWGAYLKSNVLAQFFSIYQKIITDKNMQWKFFTGLALVMAIKYAVGQEAESGAKGATSMRQNLYDDKTKRSYGCKFKPFEIPVRRYICWRSDPKLGWCWVQKPGTYSKWDCQKDSECKAAAGGPCW